MSAFVTGATGLIGRHLLERLGEDVVVTSRNPEKARGSIKHGRVIGWDGTSALAQGALDGVDAVFHLAGEPVAEGRWTDEKKKRIEESRVLSTRSIVDAMKAMTTRPKVFVCGSAVGIYGSRGDEVLTEESAPGDTFLARVCVDWEREAEKAEELGVRVVRVRIDGGDYVAAGEEPWGQVVTRVVGKGELLPSGALAAADAFDARTIAVRTSLPLADGIDAGSIVDVYLTSDEGVPKTEVVARGLTVESVEHDSGSFSGTTIETVYVVVPKAGVEDLLDALASGGGISVVGLAGGGA